MPSSMVSLESLSSPSPSPPPPADRSVSNPGTGAGLDSGSELSELTEEEQETENHQRKQEDNDDGEEEEDGRQRRYLRRGGGRKKRGGIVPAPMWDWAKPRATTVVVEEEEEEMAGPPRAMEEEEDEEEADSVPPTAVNGTVPDDEDEVEEEEEEEDAEDPQPAPPSNRAKRTARKTVDEEESGSEDSQYEWYEDVKNPRQRPPARSVSVEESGNESYSDEELSDTGAASRPGPSPRPDRPDQLASEDDNDTESEDEDGKEGDAVDLQNNARTVSGNSLAAALNSIATAATLMDVDVTAPSPKAVAPLAAAAAASSIMAGSSVLNPPSASPSPTSSVSGSPASSRSPSPSLDRTPGKPAEGQSARPSRRKRDKTKPTTADEDIGIPSNVADESMSVHPHPDAEIEGSAEDVEIQDADQDQDLELELESDLQPAHRAEALDVLATIELKFALLRERLYVEKMEGLAWEESLVSEGAHPELIHLHAELSKRRDKRLELATRKRSYEVINATKRRKVDEDAVWSWWTFARDDLQTEMVAETNRRRRRLERDRRALERPQPIRRIPNRPHDIPAAPSLRKIAKTFPFTGNRESTSYNHSVTPLVYPELSTLSSADVSSDLEFFYSNRRPPFDPHRMGNMNPVNTNAPPIGQPLPQFDSYGVNGGMPMDPLPFGASGNRMPPPPPPFQHQHPHPHSQLPGGQQAPSPFAPLGSGPPRSQHHHPSALNNHAQPPPPFAVEHEMSLIPNASSSGPGHIPHHLRGPGPGSAPGVQSGHAYPHQGHLGMRRSISPVQVMPHPSGAIPGPGTRGKQNTGWMGDGGMSNFHVGQKQPGPNEWMGEGRRGDPGLNETIEEDMRIRAREREREKRERERDKARERIERDRERDREHRDYEHEHDRDNRYHSMHGVQPQQPRHPPPPHQHLHLHSAPGQAPHHQLGPHHHHHHHHLVHHHHPQQGGGQASSSGPPVMPPGPLSAGSMPSPRPREYEPSRPTHTTEIINLSSSKPSLPTPGPSSLWKVDSESHLSASEYREIRSKHGSRPSSGPPIAPLGHDERERPLAMPFVMSSNHSSTSAPGLVNGQSTSTSALSPRGPWIPPEENPHRLPPPSSSTAYPGGMDSHSNSPAPHRYSRPSQQPPLSRQSSMGLSSPHTRHPLPPHSPPTSSMFPGPMRSPTRFPPASQPAASGPSLSGSTSHPPLTHHSTSSHGSVSTSPILKTHRSGSPKIGISGPSVFSPLLSGPGRTSTPATLGPPVDIHSSSAGPNHGASFGVSSRTASPLNVFPPHSNHPPSVRPPPNTSVSDKHSPRMPPALPPPKMNVAQMVDGP